MVHKTFSEMCRRNFYIIRCVHVSIFKHYINYNIPYCHIVFNDIMILYLIMIFNMIMFGSRAENEKEY